MKRVNAPLLCDMSEWLCAGEARKLHVKFGAFTTPVTSAVGTEGRPRAPDVPTLLWSDEASF